MLGKCIFTFLHFISAEGLNTCSTCQPRIAETYHMIDRCDSEIATWSSTGDNFVVKNVEKFASVSDTIFFNLPFDAYILRSSTCFSMLQHVLPLYFKHSNFSSFARQVSREASGYASKVIGKKLKVFVGLFTLVATILNDGA